MTFMQALAKSTKNAGKKINETIKKLNDAKLRSSLIFEKLQGLKGFCSVRVDDDYRIVLFDFGDGSYLALWADKHDEAHRWAKTHKIAYESKSGSFAIVESPLLEEESNASREKKDAPRLFDALTDERLLALGVPQDKLDDARAFASISDVEAFKERLPSRAYESLMFLAQGDDYDEILALWEDDETKTPRKREPEVKLSLETLKNSASSDQFWVPESEKELKDALDSPLETWRCFLHPTQRRLARKNFSGSARVLGAAGSGKTVVAVHRVKYLAEYVFTAPSDRILATTFTKNLAFDFKELLESVCARETLKRVEVLNISAWAARYVKKKGYKFQIDRDDKLSEECWDAALALVPHPATFGKQFFKDEHALIIRPQNIRSFDEYKRASRAGRGRAISRKDKEALWPVFAEYQAQIAERRVKTYDELYADVALLLENDKNRPFKYRSIVVDEAQDLSLSAYRMLRAIVVPGENDLFFVGDARQRIYGYKSSLSAAGIDIRGRGQKLKINYRTTAETFDYASKILGDAPCDDLSGGTEPSGSYVSLRRGRAPKVKIVKNADEEKQFVLASLNALRQEGTALRNVCVVARTEAIRDDFERFFKENDLPCARVEPERSANDPAAEGVRLATAHRVKGLEFDAVFVVSANDGLFPLAYADENCDESDPIAKDLVEKKERALLYVALTRARKDAFVTAYGKVCPFLP